MDKNDTGGLATVLATLGLCAEPDGQENQAAQEDFFENTTAPLPLAEKGKSGPGGGRPKGSRNRTTQEWARYLLGRHRSPLSVLAEIYSRDAGELTRELQAIADKAEYTSSKVGETITVKKVLIDPLDVVKLQMQAAIAVAPYVHGKMPLPIDVAPSMRGMMVIGDIGGGDGADGIGLPLPDDDAENQAVIDVMPGKSDATEAVRSEKDSDWNALEFRDD